MGRVDGGGGRGYMQIRRRYRTRTPASSALGVLHLCPLLKARLKVIAPHGQRFFRERGRPAPDRKVAEGKARIENVAGFFGLAV